MPTYEGYARVSVVGSAGGQQITNTFYYGNDVFEPLVENDAFLSLFGAGWLAAFGEDYLGEQTEHYTASQVEVSMVNTRGVTISENTAEIAFVGAGDIVQTIPGPGLAAILSVKTTGVEIVGGAALKRSYIAWGPVPGAFIQSTGELTLLAKSAYANIAAMVGATLSIGVFEYQPVRIGRTVAPAPVRVASIISVAVKPFVRPRGSRFATDTGT